MPSPTDAQRIVTLYEGAAAPAGYEIVRILATSARHVGPGTNYVTTYTVAIAPAAPGAYVEACTDALLHLAMITPHTRGCDEPDDPGCPACVIASELARIEAGEFEAQPAPTVGEHRGD